MNFTYELGNAINRMGTIVMGTALILLLTAGCTTHRHVYQETTTTAARPAVVTTTTETTHGPVVSTTTENQSTTTVHCLPRSGADDGERRTRNGSRLRPGDQPCGHIRRHGPSTSRNSGVLRALLGSDNLDSYTPFQGGTHTSLNSSRAMPSRR